MSEIQEEDTSHPKQSEMVLFDLETQIDNLKQRIRLSEAEWKAEKEDREEKARQNKIHIKKLRQEIQELQIQLSKAKLGDEKIIKKAFRKHAREAGVMKGRSGKNAVEILEGKVFDLCKKKNALQHEINMKEKILSDTKQQYEEMVAVCNMAMINDPSESESAQQLRELENEFQKVQMKISEAEHVQRKYKAIQKLLIEELITLPKQLEDLEEQFWKQRDEIDNLIATQEKAESARDSAREMLSKVEVEAVHSRQQRDKVVSEFNQVVEQRQQQQADSEGAIRKRLMSLLPDSPSMAEKLRQMQDEQEKELAFFTEAFDQIKEATGVTDIQDAEGRFVAQNTIRENLQELKQRAEKRVSELKEEKKQLEAQLESLKGAEQTKTQAEMQENIQKCKTLLTEQEKQKATTQAELDQVTQLLAEIKSGLWHQLQLMERHLSEGEEGSCPPPDIPVLELAELCENRIEDLMGYLEGQDLGDLKRQMQQEGFLQKKEEEKVSEDSVPTTAKPKPAAPEESSSSEEDDAQGRTALKKQAQVFAEVKKKQKGRGRQLLKF